MLSKPRLPPETRAPVSRCAMLREIAGDVLFPLLVGAVAVGALWLCVMIVAG